MNNESLQRYYDTQMKYWQGELSKYEDSPDNATRCKHMVESLKHFAINFNLNRNG